MTTKVRRYEVDSGCPLKTELAEWLTNITKNQDEFLSFREFVMEMNNLGLSILDDELYRQLRAMAEARTDKSPLESKIRVGGGDFTALLTILTLAGEVTDHIYGKNRFKR